ncbi:MAG TPA: MmcQ/YjbR family DNA-binding protein, partial [Acetobacteraceae bacterium]|nr:MmcQ/YjbR family DNA-binding protein [Acetobacteraceae bacterium]
MPRTALPTLRRLCLALPEAEERETWGEATFRIRGRIFAMHLGGKGGPALWCKAPPGAQAILVEADPARFFVPPYVGHKGWLGIRLGGRPDWKDIAMHLRRSYALVAPRRLALQAGSDLAPARPAPRRPLRRAAPLALLGLAASPAGAATLDAIYTVHQAGLRVAEARIQLRLDERG